MAERRYVQIAGDLVRLTESGELKPGGQSAPAGGCIPVLQTSRIGLDEAGEPIRLTVTVTPAGRNRLLINVGEIPKGGPA